MIIGVGPFSQLLTMDGIALKGAVPDSKLEILPDGALILSDDVIIDRGSYKEMRNRYSEINFINIDEPSVCLPGFVDVHTHMCWGGSRSPDYAGRIAGKSYSEIALEGGGINVSVRGTRDSTADELKNDLKKRAQRHFHEGVTTCEVKSGYGLNRESELKMLSVIRDADRELPIDLIASVLAAHIKPYDFEGSHRQYLDYVLREILPEVLEKKLALRADIFIDDGAFSLEDGRYYLEKVKELGFDLVVHADQFTPGSSRLAVQYGALSADHLESITDEDIDYLGHSETAAVALPGCSLGLGIDYAPARKLLDRGASLVISTDWNPGSAPMGDLLLQASVLGAEQKLSTAEILSAITFRAAHALGLDDRGILKKAMKADFLLFSTGDYRDILYNQGKMKPSSLWKNGVRY